MTGGRNIFGRLLRLEQNTSGDRTDVEQRERIARARARLEADLTPAARSYRQSAEYAARVADRNGRVEAVCEKARGAKRRPKIADILLAARSQPEADPGL